MTEKTLGNVSIYRNFNDTVGHVISIDKALERIAQGKSKDTVLKAQSLPKKEADEVKKTLPAVCFSGTFKSRKDSELIEHSGYIVLDFDGVEDVKKKKEQLSKLSYVTATWVSPSGKGVKALVRIKHKNLHNEHFMSMLDEIPGVDRTGKNLSRLCFESYDPEIYINKNAKEYDKIASKEKREMIAMVVQSGDDVFGKLIKWMTSRGDAFREGERNHFVFKLASACCRFGIPENEAQILILGYVSADSSFTRLECQSAVKSAYKSSSAQFATAEFKDDVLVTKIDGTKVDVVLTEENLEEMGKEDVIYASDVRSFAESIYLNGYIQAKELGVPELDKHFKRVKGDLTVISGIGNYGKSSFMKWEMLFRLIRFGEKVAIFTPEELPAEQFYHDLVEIYFGRDCTPRNPMRPHHDSYMKVYDWIGENIFMVYPKSVSPTPNYVKEVFLSLVVKHGVERVVIDPFNQMANDYGKSGGRSDKYLETFLSDCTRFAKKNNVYFDVVVHPHKMKKGDDGNYPCPDVFDLADGAMWNNKADNILIYHRPFAQTTPDNPACEFHSKKIRRQKIVGVKGSFDFELNRSTRRYTFGGTDYMQKYIDDKFVQSEMKFEEEKKPKKPSDVYPNLKFLEEKGYKIESAMPWEQELNDMFSNGGAAPKGDCPF